MGIEKDFEKFLKERSEIAEQIKKATDMYSIEAFMDSLAIKASLDDVLKNESEFTFKCKNHNPIIYMYGSRIALAIALCEMMNHDGDFYGMLRMVCRYWEMKKMGGVHEEQCVKKTNSKEELDVLREMMYKSPEEVEKLMKETEKK